MLAPNVIDTPKDASVPPVMKRKDEDNTWVGVDIMPTIIRTSMLPNDDGRVRVSELIPEQTEKLFKKLDLSGIEEWSMEDQEELRALIGEFGSLFASDDLDLGKMAIVKHTIKLTDPVMFKERYRCILPHQFEEVKNTCRKCWPLEPSASHEALGLGQSFW